MDCVIVKSPLGNLKITGNSAGIISLEFTMESCTDHDSPSLNSVVFQLYQYFNGSRTTFDVKLNPSGTEFQQEVWSELQKVTYGKTQSYIQIAKALGDPKKVRAVGTANGRNPIPIIIPCHRIIGSDGGLVGFSGGMWRKEYLLKLEGIIDGEQLGLF